MTYRSVNTYRLGYKNQSSTAVYRSNAFFSYDTYKTHQRIQINQPTSCINLSDLLLVVQIQLNLFRASSCPSSGAYKLQQQPLVQRWNVVVAVLLVVVGPAVCKRKVINLRNCCIWLVDSFECMMMHGLENPKFI